MQSSTAAPVVLHFGRFTAVPHWGTLLQEGRAVDVGGRAFDLLMALIEADGKPVSSESLIQRVWPNRVVEDNNLQVQLTALRKALGADRDLIRTIAKSGYQFMGTVHRTTDLPAVATSPTNLPQASASIVGRETEIASLLDIIKTHRLVTLVGTGGIGKTRLAIELGRTLRENFLDGAWIAEFGPITDPELIPAVIARSIGIDIPHPTITLDRVSRAIGGRQLLLILDNCEHLIERAAQAAGFLIQYNPGIRLLVTSREPLNAEIEHAHRVPSLTLPAAGLETALSPDASSAVALFTTRARAIEPRFAAGAEELAAIGALCRKLDGIPLAIELAAARAATLGVAGLAAYLDDTFRLLTDGSRTALPRHRTLRATLDWSYDLLKPTEALVLQRLAIFSGSFSLTAAVEVLQDDAVSRFSVVESIANLVSKSLLAAEFDGCSATYRLLEITRHYALEKLRSADGLGMMTVRHAQYCRHCFALAHAERDSASSAQHLQEARRLLDDLRRAEEWAFSKDGDRALGICMSAAAAPVLFELAFIEECRKSAERALQAIGDDRNWRRERMQVLAARAATTVYASGPSATTHEAWTTVLALATELGDREHQLIAVWGYWIDQVYQGAAQNGLMAAQRFVDLGSMSEDREDLLMGHLMLGVSSHYCGDHVKARHNIERMLSDYQRPAGRSSKAGYQLDPELLGQVVLARMLWLQGQNGPALSAVATILDSPDKQTRVASLCNAAAASCVISLYIGSLDHAERGIALLAGTASRHGLDAWAQLARCFEAILMLRQGEEARGLHALRTEYHRTPSTTFIARYNSVIGELAEALGRAGEYVAALTLVDESLKRSAGSGERWFTPELLRIKGTLLLQMGPDHGDAAQQLFIQSINIARHQSALSWECRTMVNLAAHWCNQGEVPKARDGLQRVCSRFAPDTPGTDLAVARRMLAALDDARDTSCQA